jgi:VCBS repeat-containing protein
LTPSSLSDDVSTDAKFNAFNYLPITRIAAVFKDRSSQPFNPSGSGDYGTNSFAGHTWTESIASQTMLSRFNTNLNVSAGTGVFTSYSKYRESNSASGKLVFPYQTGYAQYGYANTNAQFYRWGVTFNNESNQGSNDSVSGIGLASYSAAGVLGYSDSLSYTVNGTNSGAQSGGSQVLQSGFQIWGKMAAGTLAAPSSLVQSQQSSSSTRVSWGAVASATEYLVQYKTSAQSWSQGSTVRVTNPSASPSATLTGLTDSSYNLRIWARGTGNLYASASGSLTLSLDQTAPTITGPSSAAGATSSKSIAENSTAVHTFTANESVTWSKSGTDGSFFSIASNGDLTITARDFESPADSGANNTYEVVVTATDAMGNAKNQTVTITITNVNDAPSITINGSGATHAISQAENTTSVITYTATDVDAGASLSFSISGTDAADFAINSSSGALTFAASPDFESPVDSDVNNTYVVIVTVSDGSLSDTQTLTVTITNVNENSNIGAPTVSGTINKGVATTITVTSDVAGKVRFFVGGKRISNCLARSTTGSSPSFTATCSWKPPVTGRQSLTARITPTNSSFTTATSEATSIWVVRRSNSR